MIGPFIDQDVGVRVLVTGSSGQVGSAVARLLDVQGWTVRRFDLTDGDDLRDAAAVHRAAAGCDAVVHAGAIAHDTAGAPDDIVATNVLGTWHVLSAAEAHGVGRVVVFSSAQVFGCAAGEGVPAYLPVDDEHPLRAARPYGMSKRLAEEMCAAWTDRTGTPTLVFRPVMILDDEALRRATADAVEFGAFVHLDDVADATRRALDVEPAGHTRMILCGPGAFDSSQAERILGWRAARSWPSGPAEV